MRQTAIAASSSALAGRNLSAAPQYGGSSALLKRTATKLLPPISTTEKKSPSVMRSGFT
jgi:hypothetical protein